MLIHIHKLQTVNFLTVSSNGPRLGPKVAELTPKYFLFLGSRYILPGEDGRSALMRFISFQTEVEVTPVEVYCERVVSKVLLPRMPYEIYEGSKAGLAKFLTAVPNWIVHYFLKKNCKIDVFSRELNKQT